MLRSIEFRAAALLAVLATHTVTDAAAQLKNQTQVGPSNELPNPYVRVYPWGDLSDASYAERPSFIAMDEGPDGAIYLLDRCRANSCVGRPEPPILKLDRSGKLLASWGAGSMDFPHGMDIDRQGHVWTADQQGQQVLEWSADGELLMTIGRKGVAGDPPLLSEPTDVAVAPNGDVFITQGHSFARGANRVSKYAPDGTFLMAWGKTGSGPGEFNVPHTIAFDSQGRVFVGDRANNRIQIFDQNGTFLDVWYQFSRPSGIAIDAQDRIYVADSESWGTDNPGWRKGIRVGSARDGSVQYLIEDLEPTAIEHSGAEGVGVDSQGNVYGGVVRRRMLEQHVLTQMINPPSPAVSAAGGPPHVGHVAAAFAGAPNGKGLAATATTEAGIAMLHANFAAGNLGDLDAMQLHAGHVLHALDPPEGSRGPGTGFGLVRAAEAVATHIGLAAQAPGASANVRTHAEHIATVAHTVEARAQEAAALARAIQSATTMREASPLVARLRALTYQIAEGYDADGDGQLALNGEAGLQQMEAHIYLLLEGEGLPRAIR
jgi:NHL repeat